jgi:hypothetical protein
VNEGGTAEARESISGQMLPIAAKHPQLLSGHPGGEEVERQADTIASLRVFAAFRLRRHCASGWVG